MTTLAFRNPFPVHCVDISSQAQHVQSMKLIWRPIDLILVLLLLAAIAFTALRGLVGVDHIRVMKRHR